MTTSGVITSSLTASDIVTSALELLGIYGAGETVSAEDGALGLKHLNWMLKSMQADGCNLWREYEDSQVFAQGDTEKALSPFVLDVLEARVVTSTTTERPLARWEWGQWVQIPNKTTQGTPTCFVLRKERDATKMRLWPVPSASKTINYTAARVIEDVTALSETVDVPQAWTECMYHTLAVRLLGPFQVTLTPATAKLIQTAEGLYAALRDMDRPASVFFS